MKKKILATFMACLTLTVGALAFSACDGENADGNNGNSDNLPESPIDAARELTEEQWKTEISNFKGFGNIKNYTVTVSAYVNSEIYHSESCLVDFENLQIYMPDNNTTEDNSAALIYFKMGESYTLEEHTVCDCRELRQSVKDGLYVENYEKLDFNSAYTIFSFSALLTQLQNLKHNETTINFEDAYSLFTYNEETGTYVAKGIDVAMGYWESHYSEANGYHSISFEYFYSTFDLEIEFRQNFFTMRLILPGDPDAYAEVTINNINDTQINLKPEHTEKLA